MSTTYPTHDSIRIPPKPRLAKPDPAASSLPLQLAFSAGTAFGLAWLLTQLIIG
ncbi:MAG: hypothetical protein K5Q68_19845 [Roseococcus sp.]|nr:hypothetical protein [Roseococcus sp.]